jgi:hypothetical protein
VAITRIGAGAGVTGTGDITPTYPTAYTAVAGDVAVIHLNVTVADTGEYTTPSGWTKVGTILNEIGSIDGRSTVYLKRLDASEALPTITGDTVDQFVAFCEIYRGVNTATPLDVSAVTSEANNTTTFTPTGVTTVTNGAWAISSIGVPFNGGTVGLATAQSFTLGAQAATTSGANVTAASAYREVATAGAVTFPTWEKTQFTGIGQWCSVAFALRPEPDPIAPTASEGWVGVSAGQVAPAAPAPTAGYGIDYGNTYGE